MYLGVHLHASPCHINERFPSQLDQLASALCISERFLDIKQDNDMELLLALQAHTGSPASS